MGDATVFSRPQQIIFPRPVIRTEVETGLKKMLLAIGEQLSYNKIILGHIKVLARLPAKDDYLFLSVTRLDTVDIKVSPKWLQAISMTIDSIELDINVLVFGYSIGTVEKVVNAALRQAVQSFEKDGSS